MTQLLTPREAAAILGTNVAQVKEWSRRVDHPLPTILVGSSGRFRKIVSEEIPAWLKGEIERQRPQPVPH